MKLSDRRTPTCYHCGMAKLEIEDIIDTSSNYEECKYTEFVVGVCPNCNHTFSYSQEYTLEPIGYDDVVDITEDEEEEDD